VKNLVHQNQAQIALFCQELTFQHNLALAQKAGCMNRRSALLWIGREQPAAIGGQFGLGADANRAAEKFRQPDLGV
jgi:hypothetical protein